MRSRTLFLLSAFLVTPVSEAGTFVLDQAWYTETHSDTRINVRVGSSAFYDGEVDIGDNQWGIEANLIVAGITYWASGVSGSGITSGMRVTCSDSQCGGFHEFDKCPSTTYEGYGVVAIYHQYTPETSRKDLETRWTACLDSGGDDGGTCESGGLLNEPESGTCCQGECTPILLDLGGADFELSGPEPPVEFDIDADGVADAISWTRRGGDEVFLALDRNGNGVIDDGSELFGAATDQPPSNDANGFLALAVFDQLAAGGNGDGRITAEDAVFSRLVLWNDIDRDGTSRPWELTSLGDHGIVEVSIDYVLSERRDRYGNRFRWTGSARTTEVRPIVASDVVFVSAPNQSLTPR